MNIPALPVHPLPVDGDVVQLEVLDGVFAESLDFGLVLHVDVVIGEIEQLVFLG